MLFASSSTEGAEQAVLAIALVILIGPFLIGKARLPGIVGLVLGGAIIGPETLGWLKDGQLDGVGDIGLLYLMFMAGLELDLIQLKQYQKAALRFGLLTFAMPFAVGWIGASVAGEPRASAILLGSIWASHTLVALPEIKRAGLSGNRAVAICVSATALTDTLALVVLAVVTSGAADEPGGRPMVELGVGLVVLVAYCLWLLPLIGRHIFRLVAQERTLRFVFLLAAFSSAAMLAASFGIEGLVGAFMAGLGANRLVPAGGPLMDRTEFMGEAFFIPAFLVFVGTQLDLGALGSIDTLLLAGGFVAIVLVGKSLAAIISGRIESLTWREVGLMVGLSSGQAAATLAATLVGQEVGLFDETIVNGVLVAVLLVILVSSLITAAFARKVPPSVVSERALGSTVLLSVPEDGVSDQLVGVATRLSMAHGGRLVPLGVAEAGGGVERRRAVRAAVDAAAEVATSLGADVEGVLRVDASLSDGVLNAIVEHDASVVVLPWDLSTSRSERMFGRMLDEIGARSPVPVVAGEMAQSPPTRTVLALGAAAVGGGAEVDDAEASALVSALASGGDLAVALVSGPVPDELGLSPSVSLQSLPAGGLADGLGELAANDLVVVPNSRLLRSGEHRGLAAGDRPVLAVAGAYRFRTGAAASTSGIGSMLGLERSGEG
ncbi:MAG: cation:proton antiporter [Microthrixaceae bacterium]